MIHKRGRHSIHRRNGNQFYGTASHTLSYRDEFRTCRASSVGLINPQMNRPKLGRGDATT